MLTFVTGAAGFIGRTLCQRLKRKEKRVRVLLRSDVQGPWDEIVLGDLVNVLLEEAMCGVDTIFHLAGKAHALSETLEDEQDYFSVNTDGTRMMLEAAKAAGVRRFVLFSSVKAIDEGGDQVRDETTECRPVSPYGKSKLEAERLVLNGGYVPEPVVLRLSMVYGPTLKGNLPRMIEAVSKGRFPPVPEMGNGRSMVHVDDVVQAALLAAEKPQAINNTYIVTGGQNYSTRQIYDLICKVLGKPKPNLTVSPGMLKILAFIGDWIGRLRGKRFVFDSDSLEKLLGSAIYSSDKIRSELGFEPKWDLQGALPDIVKHIGLK